MWRLFALNRLARLWLLGGAMVVVVAIGSRLLTLLLFERINVLHDTYYVIFHFHYELGLLACFALLAAWHAFFPRLTGLANAEGWGRMQFWLTIAGAMLTLLAGPASLFGMAARDMDDPDTFARVALFWNNIAALGAYLAMAGLVCFFIGLLTIAARARGSRVTPHDD